MKIKMKRMLAVALAVVLVVGLVPTTAEAAKKGKVKSIAISNVNSSTLVLKKGKTFSLKVKVSTSGKASKKVSYSSSNKKVATISKSGKIKAVKNGTAKITVKSNYNKKKKATLTVKVGTPVKSVKLDKSTATMKVGESLALKATVSPSKATIKKVTYASDNKEIATVSSKGEVTAITEGKVTITVKATDGSKKTAKCVIDVVKADVATTTEKQTTEKQTTEKETTEKDTTEETTQEVEKGNDVSYSGYELKFEDNFDGNSLDRTNWNVETHEAGWVNSELQAYVDSDENILVNDGKLTIKPIKTVGEDGEVTYTSGRINTQGKQDYKYGLFEVKAKVPTGQGYLPAFWMMPTNENLYGQWPRCGEIDAMEVMGQDTKKLFGTIHYGNPHAQSQGTYVLQNGNFASQYHTYTCEWEPGKITWYVDGHKYHEESSWYSTTTGQGTIAYPAPFDQPFYVILNLAIGGSWVGNPDENTTFDDQAFSVDYVKVYQKSEYDENVEKPVKEVILRDPDETGNYVINGNFATSEDLSDETDWVFMNALGGEATASIADNAISIKTTKEGTADYSVQLVQAKVPFEKGATYEVAFDAKASEARTIKTSVKAPNYNYMEYMESKTVDLTTEKQHYAYTFKMKSDSDDNGRIEFNMGAADSLADVEISNVTVKQTVPANPDEVEVKGILADGNHVYNGAFQEGTGRLEYWDITNIDDKASVSVTGLGDGRRLKVTVEDENVNETDVILSQSDLALTAGTPYAFSFEAQADSEKTMKVVIGGKEFSADLTTDKQVYTFKIPEEEVLADKNIAFYMGKMGTTYIDNIRLVEDTMIKNGSFDAGMAGYEWYADSSASASYVIDSLTEDNALDVTVKNTGDQDWKIQVKQNNVELEKGQWYKLTFKAKSSLERKIRVIMQGTEKKEYAVYSGENTVDLTNDYQTFEKVFQMKADTDPEAFLSICLGKIDEQITTQHRICIDDISLDMTEEPELPPVVAGENMLVNADFSNEDDAMKGWTETIANWGSEYVTEASRSIKDGAIIYDIANPGTEDWHVQLKQSGLNLEKGCSYKVTFNVKSTAARTIKTGVMSTGFDFYGGSDEVLEADIDKEISIEFTMSEADRAADFYISMGQIDDLETPASEITISNLKFVKVTE